MNFWSHNMGISDKIKDAADDKEAKRLKKSTEELVICLKSLESTDLIDIISEIENIIESGLYERLIINTTKNMKSDNDIICMGTLLKNRVITTAYYKLGTIQSLKNFVSNRYNAGDTSYLYILLESIYTMNTDRELDFNDKLNVYLSGLDERILFNPINFDDVNLDDIPEPNIEFFKSLVNIKWIDKETETVYNKLKSLMNDSASLIIINSDLDVSSTDFWIAEENFIELLIVCSTLSTGKTLIHLEDMIRGYMAFFKLINTDISTYESVTERLKNIKDKGWLVCENCGYSYHLQPNESPEDFVDKCECGDKLRYKKNIEDPFEKNVPEDIFVPMIITMICIGGLAAYSLLQGMHLNGSAGSVRLMLFASAVFVSGLLYFVSRSLFGYFGWKFDTASIDQNNSVLLCKECKTKYALEYDESINNFPKTCSCGGKLICMDSKEVEKGIDLRYSRRIVYALLYLLSFFILYSIFRAFNIDLIVLYNGEWKYFVLIVVLIFTVFLTTLILRLLNKIGIKIKYY